MKMTTFIKNVWDEFENITDTALIFCSFFAWGLPAILVGTAAFLIWTVNPILTSVFIIANLFVLYYGSFPRMRGDFSGFQKVLVFAAAVLQPYWFFTTLVVYFLTVAPAFVGMPRQKIVGYVLLFLFNPLTFILFAFGVLFLGAGDVFSFTSLQKWHRAACAICQKPLQGEVLIKRPICGPCLSQVA